MRNSICYDIICILQAKADNGSLLNELVWLCVQTIAYSNRSATMDENSAARSHSKKVQYEQFRPNGLLVPIFLFDAPYKSVAIVEI